MRFRSALSTARDAVTAAAECQAEIAADAATPPDLVLVFAAPSLTNVDRAGPELFASLRPRTLCGCSGRGVLANGREIESRPALAVIAAWLPGVEVHAEVFTELPSPDAPPSEWRRMLGLVDSDLRGIVILADPWSTPTADLLDGLDFALPGVPKFGGLVSGSATAADQHLFLADQSLQRGFALISFRGAIAIESIVSQGCRPLGRVGTVTEGLGQNLVRVDGQRAIDFLHDQIHGLSEAELEGIQRATMFIGLATNPLAATPPSDRDFLMRDIVGVDRAKGSIAIAGRTGAGRKIRFHLRDAAASAEDLDRALERARRRGPIAGALMFTCLGRGRDLYGEAHHDSRALMRHFGETPLAGFFCGGEIGPIAGRTHLHGYTSSLALFRPPAAPTDDRDLGEST
jgi:small ligand-binding sensory domain FIST